MSASILACILVYVLYMYTRVRVTCVYSCNCYTCILMCMLHVYTRVHAIRIYSCTCYTSMLLYTLYVYTRVRATRVCWCTCYSCILVYVLHACPCLVTGSPYRREFQDLPKESERKALRWPGENFFDQASHCDIIFLFTKRGCPPCWLTSPRLLPVHASELCDFGF